MALTMLNVLIIYCILYIKMVFITGAELILRFQQLLIMNAYIYIQLLIHVHSSLHVTSQLATPPANVNWKLYALIEWVHGF